MPNGVGVVLMFMVTKVFYLGLGLVPAVRRHGRPAELQRQQGEQEDGEEPAHGRESSGCRVQLVTTKATDLWGFTTSRRGCVPRFGSSHGG